jgi:hypothetical protein
LSSVLRPAGKSIENWLVEANFYSRPHLINGNKWVERLKNFCSFR